MGMPRSCTIMRNRFAILVRTKFRKLLPKSFIGMKVPLRQSEVCMNWPDFSNPKHFYVVICFVEADDFAAQRERLEVLGKQNNVRLVVQPCPYEALEFLYRLNA